MIWLKRESSEFGLRTDRFPEGTRFLVAGDLEDTGNTKELKVYAFSIGESICYADPWVKFEDLREIGLQTKWC